MSGGQQGTFVVAVVRQHGGLGAGGGGGGEGGEVNVEVKEATIILQFFFSLPFHLSPSLQSPSLQK